MQLRVRALVFAGIASALAAALVAGGPVGAVAAAGPLVPIPADGLTALTAPASLVTGARTGLTGARLADATAIQMYSFLKGDKAVWAAVAAAGAGTATPQQTALVQQTPRPAIPATRFGTLSKVVNGVAAPLASYQLGATVTGGILNLVGMDAQGTVCRWSAENGIAGEAVAFAAGQICGGYGPASGYVPNSDAAAGPVTGGSSCVVASDPATCYTLQVSGKYDAGYGAYNVYCFTQGAATNSFYYATERQAELGSNPSSGFGCPSGQVAIYLQNAALGLTMTKFWTTDYYGNPTPKSTIVDGTADPQRQLCTQVTSVGGVMSEFCSAPYKESDPQWTKPLPPELPEGVVPKSIRLVEKGNGAPKPLADLETTPEYQTLQQLAPECFTNLCMVNLEKLLAGGSTVSCLSSPSECADWFTDANKADNYRCTWGGKSVPLTECNGYAPTFKAQTQGKPTTVGDPQTGAPLTNPLPNATPGTGVVPNPATGGSQNCFDSGWSSAANPLEWVLVPVKCALSWAFVPSQKSLDDQFGKINGKFQASWLGATVAAGTAFVGLSSAATGCQGPPFIIDVPAWGLNYTGYPMSACDAPMDAIAATLKGTGGVVVWLLSFLAVLRYVATIFGYAGFGGGSSMTAAQERVANGEGNA